MVNTLFDLSCFLIKPHEIEFKLLSLFSVEETEGTFCFRRWQRNRTGRTLSPLQIHQKIIWMLSNFHKTTSECWQRTPGTQKGSPISSKGGRIKYKRWKQRQKIEGSRPILGRESWRRSFHTVGKPLTGRSVGSFRLSEGNITKRKTKHRLCT